MYLVVDHVPDALFLSILVTIVVYFDFEMLAELVQTDGLGGYVFRECGGQGQTVVGAFSFQSEAAEFLPVGPLGS